MIRKVEEQLTRTNLTLFRVSAASYPEREYWCPIYEIEFHFISDVVVRDRNGGGGGAGFWEAASVAKMAAWGIQAPFPGAVYV
jgi:hypothetical protein